MSDLLSAQSLLLAVLAALFSAWSTGFATAALKKTQGTRYADNENVHKIIKEELFVRAFPLTLYALALAAVMMPVSWSILKSVVSYYARRDPKISFDPIGASLVLVHVGLIAFFGYLCTVVTSIWVVHKKFKVFPR